MAKTLADRKRGKGGVAAYQKEKPRLQDQPKKVLKRRGQVRKKCMHEKTVELG